MRILLLGASGRTGKYILSQGLEKGYCFNVIVRNTIKISPKEINNCTVFLGSPIDKLLMQEAMQGCDVVITALNISRKSDFPWAPLRTPKDLLSRTMRNIVALARLNKIKHIISCSAWGAADSIKDIPWWFRLTIQYSNIKFAYKDHELQETILKQAKVPYTIVRPTGLYNGQTITKIQQSFKNIPKPNLLINRKTLAFYMLSIINTPQSFFKIVTISKK